MFLLKISINNYDQIFGTGIVLPNKKLIVG